MFFQFECLEDPAVQYSDMLSIGLYSNLKKIRTYFFPSLL